MQKELNEDDEEERETWRGKGKGIPAETTGANLCHEEGEEKERRKCQEEKSAAEAEGDSKEKDTAGTRESKGTGGKAEAEGIEDNEGGEGGSGKLLSLYVVCCHVITIWQNSILWYNTQ